MKRVVIIHCWEGYPEYCWHPQVKKDLKQLGFKVKVPAMPETERPQLDKWLPKLKEVVGNPDEELYLIGHSSGVITILRYLENLSEGQKIGGAVLVAGFIDDLSYMDSVEDKTVLPSFFQTPINWHKIKSHTNNFVAIHSDNDPYVQLKHADVFREKLDAKVIIRPGMKHFSGSDVYEESCTELPDVVEAVKQMV
jgi:uncharacterized protein